MKLPWLHLGDSPHEPTAERRLRGLLTFKAGGSGTADVLRFLRKNTSDTYERVDLATSDDLHDALTVSDTTSIDLTLADQALSADANFGTTSGTVAEGDHDHDSDYAKLTDLHDAVTVTDTTSIDLTLTGQNVKADANFGTTSGTVAEGDHTHSQLHDPVTVTDSTSVDLTLSDQNVTATVKPAGVNHNSLAGLTTGDPHTQYVKKAGDTVSGDLTVSGETTLGGLTVSSLNTPKVVLAAQDNADTSSTSNTSNTVAAMTATVDLPTGTWTVSALGEVDLTHSADGTSVATVQVNGVEGDATIRTAPSTGSLTTFRAIQQQTGISGGGTVSVRVRFRSNTSGTTGATNPSLVIVAERTA